jgi:hypothetical protein
MSDTASKYLPTFCAALALAIGFIDVSRAHADPVRGSAPHGGTLEKTKHYQFEVVCAADGIKVYAYGMEGKPLDGSKLTGTATFYHPSSPKPWFDRPLRAVAVGPGQAASSLNLTTDLSKVPAKGVKVVIEITGLPDPDEATSTITVAYSVPSVSPAVITFTKATSADQAAISAQKVCKISGGDLFAMGGPVKVSRGDKSTFICCKSCLKEIQANPDKYLGKPTATPGAK